MNNVFLILGLIFPLLSWFTLICGAIQHWRTKKSSSGIYIPFIGPILIDIWFVSVGSQSWTLIVPWVLDIGTLSFLWVLPRLIADAWQTSRFTRTFLFVGSEGNQTVGISLHKSGRYMLRKKWQRPPNELGITSLGEPGTFEVDRNDFILTSHVGWKRIIRKQDKEFFIRDTESEGDYRLDGWNLEQRSA
jgi:hypothetical protein